MIVDIDRITALARGSPIEGGRIALGRIKDCLAKGASFTQETTLSGYRTETTASDAKERGYYVTVQMSKQPRRSIVCSNAAGQTRILV